MKFVGEGGAGKNSTSQKHTKISSEEISDGRKYSLLFLYDKVEVSCYSQLKQEQDESTSRKVSQFVNTLL
uniref:hypothetical protein n=1 Tax=Streptococcus suis TaxID=1307 RepID=UPI001E3E2B0D